MAMEKAEEELERRSKFLNSLILKKKSVEEKQQNEHLNVSVRASDMSFSLQNHAFKCARENLDAMACGKLDSKRLALALKKCARDNLDAMACGKLDSKRLALAVKKHFVVIVVVVVVMVSFLVAKFFSLSFTLFRPALICYTRIDDSPETASLSRGSVYTLVGLYCEFDSTYGPAWHCIVGTSFGSYVTHSIGGFLYFSIDKGSSPDLGKNHLEFPRRAIEKIWLVRRGCWGHVASQTGETARTGRFWRLLVGGLKRV
ncbi:Dynein light chain, cytoplasmic [Capsicum annuum]|nr:Dynein light chain, cytoplasmic [Capsicum annuum]